MVFAIVIVINFVIGGFCWVGLVNWLRQLSDYRCPITANRLITLSDYNCTEWLVKNEAANAPITFQKSVLVMTKFCFWYVDPLISPTIFAGALGIERTELHQICHELYGSLPGKFSFSPAYSPKSTKSCYWRQMVNILCWIPASTKPSRRCWEKNSTK